MVLSEKKVFLTIWIMLFLSMILAIIYVSAQVKALEKQISVIDTQLINIEQDIRTSEAEWAFLTNPARIAEISKKVLPELQKITAKNIMSLEAVQNSSKYINVSLEKDNEDSVGYSVIRIAE